jgi:hypothetical protein
MDNSGTLPSYSMGQGQEKGQKSVNTVP